MNGVRGALLSCDGHGAVRRVLRNELGLPARVGAPLPAIVGEGSSRKAFEFLTAAQSGPIFGFELEAQAGRICCFAGAPDAAGTIVAASSSAPHLAEFCGELAREGGDLAEVCRAMLAARDTADEEKHRVVLDELAVLYTDFTDLQRELARRNRDLESALAERDRLLGTVAHDLRSPLAAIRNFAAYLADAAAERLGPQELQALERIEHSSDFMQKLVEGMLELSKSGFGEVALALEEARLEELLHLVVGLNVPFAERKRIRLELAVEGTLPPVSVDPHKIEQVLNNLIANAIHYSHSGTRVRVSARREGGAALVEVRDQGQGIPPDELDRLFRPFSRTSVRPTSGEPTTGLGLAIVKSIVVAHGGRVWAESAPGRGSTFRFTVPFAGA